MRLNFQTKSCNLLLGHFSTLDESATSHHGRVKLSRCRFPSCPAVHLLHLLVYLYFRDTLYVDLK